MSKHDELMAEIRHLVQPWLDELRRTITSSQTINERAAHRVSVPDVAATATNGVKTTTVANELKGYSFRETTGAAGAVVELLDGTDPSGESVISISLAPGESVRDWFGETGISVNAGLYVNRVSGQVKGAVFLRSGGST